MMQQENIDNNNSQIVNQIKSNDYKLLFKSGKSRKSEDKKKQQNNKGYQQNKDIDNNKMSCINKICPKFKFVKLNQQTKTFDPEQLCNQCLQQYRKQSYCMYCKQIYFDSSDDGKQWILCQYCTRWVHSQCANYDSNYDNDFKCIKCKKNNPECGQPAKKQPIKGNIKIPDKRKLPECSLNAFGFFWQLGTKELAEDMDKIREFLQ